MKKLFTRLLDLLTATTSPMAPVIPEEENVLRLISEIRAANLSYCGPPKLENIAEAVLQVQRDAVPGLYLEAGVALGGSAILIGRLKPENLPFELYDVFEMIPPPNENDGEDAHKRYEEIRSGTSAGLGGKKYYGYINGLIDVVKTNLNQFGIVPDRENIRFKQGLFEDTLHPVEPIAFAHIDCDWYDSVRVCIERITPYLSPGGIIIFDDYSSYSGCRRAVDEWLDRDSSIEKVFHRRSLGVRRSVSKSGSNEREFISEHD